MTKRLFIIFIFCSLGVIGFSQNRPKIDSLWHRYELEKQDTSKAGILCDISYLYLTVNADSSLVLCQKGLDLLKEEEPSTAKGLCMMNMGLSYTVKGDRFSALEYFFLARDFFLATEADKQLSDCLINIGMAEYHLKNIDKAIEYTQNALEIAEEQGNFIQKGNCYQNLGLFNQTKGNHADALDYFQKSLSIKREYKDEPRRIANTLDAMAGVYIAMDDNASALQNYEEALKLRKESGDVVGHALSFYNIGVFYHKQGDLKKALNYYETGLEKIKALNLPGYEGF
ncbi:MAG TPA: tetratricopeptide repeat protein, partial [Saprospiraceae bacterium]|nr:tetratricopeptide repeat protein [Saprospiraceae bacterium]